MTMRAVLGPTVPLSTNDAHATKTANDALGRKPAVQCVTKQDKGKLTELWGLPPVTIVRPNLSNLERGDLLGEVSESLPPRSLSADPCAGRIRQSLSRPRIGRCGESGQGHRERATQINQD